MQNFVYALIQVAHNFGAVAVVGGALLGRWPLRPEESQRHRLAWVVLAGWITQGISGAAFGAVSFYYYGQFPDIHGIAIAALLVKMGCAASGILVTAGYLSLSARWQQSRRDHVWSLLILLGVTALTAAAFLRWFS